MVIGSGVVRMPGNTLVYENTEGTTTLTMSDGKVTGATGVGKGVYKRTYGPAISGYAGKTYTYTAKATGPVTFEIEVVND